MIAPRPGENGAWTLQISQRISIRARVELRDQRPRGRGLDRGGANVRGREFDVDALWL